jgi:hypothetical protein
MDVMVSKFGALFLAGAILSMAQTPGDRELGRAQSNI